MSRAFEKLGLLSGTVNRGDRRSDERLGCRLVAVLEDAATGRLVPGTVLDISRSGMRIHTGGPVRLDNPRSLKFWFWINGSRYQITGCIKRFPGPREFAVAFESRVHSITERAVRRMETLTPRLSVAETRPRRADDRRPSAHAGARDVMRQTQVTFHDGLRLHKEDQVARQTQWVARRVASHLI